MVTDPSLPHQILRPPPSTCAQSGPSDSIIWQMRYNYHCVRSALFWCARWQQDQTSQNQYQIRSIQSSSSLHRVSDVWGELVTGSIRLLPNGNFIRHTVPFLSLNWACPSLSLTHCVLPSHDTVSWNLDKQLSIIHLLQKLWIKTRSPFFFVGIYIDYSDVTYWKRIWSSLQFINLHVWIIKKCIINSYCLLVASICSYWYISQY